MLIAGALCFGLVIGWVTYRTLRRSQTNGLSDIATIIGAVGGGAVTSLFPSGDTMFGGYCIGLAVGFFAYLAVAGIMVAQTKKHPEMAEMNTWLGADPTAKPTNPTIVPPPPG
jgi:hypothetical protein